MQEEKNALDIPGNAGQNFPQLLRQLRKEKDVSLAQLAAGLMEVSQLARIERDQRPENKNLRDRLLGRLGIASDLYETLLNIEDYTTWEQQREILCAIKRKAFLEAQELIAVYEQQKPGADRDRIKRQFCLVMRAESLRLQGAAEDDIGACYEEAVLLTVPDAECLDTTGRLLAVQEVNMILEYWYYHKGADFLDRCKKLLAFVDNAVYDAASRTKIYPKIVVYYLRELLLIHKEQKAVDLSEGLAISNRALEILHENKKTYYISELLDLNHKLAQCMGNPEAAALRARYCREDMELSCMQDCVYLYEQRQVLYIGDMLQCRRKLYGLSRQELCAGICSEKTLRRAERMQTDMQRRVQNALMERLDLLNTCRE